MVVGMGLVAHLRFHTVLFSELRQHASFPYPMSQRLLTINMLTTLHTHGGGVKVMMVRCRYDDRINFVAKFFIHLPIVSEKSGIGILFACFNDRLQPLHIPFRWRHPFRVGCINEPDHVKSRFIAMFDVDSPFPSGSDSNYRWLGQIPPSVTR